MAQARVSRLSRPQHVMDTPRMIYSMIYTYMDVSSAKSHLSIALSAADKSRPVGLGVWAEEKIQIPFLEFFVTMHVSFIRRRYKPTDQQPHFTCRGIVCKSESSVADSYRLESCETHCVLLCCMLTLQQYHRRCRCHRKIPATH